MKKIITLFILSGLTAFAAGCGKKAVESKSMDTIYKESGVPVTVQTLQNGEFRSDCLFHSELTGLEETTAYAAVNDKVEKILFSVGDRIAQDEIVITFPTDNPATPYYQTKTALDHAQTTLARIKNLYESGGISLQEYENTKTQYEVTKANWDAVQRAVRVKAPIGGVITRMDVQKSDNVKSGDPLFTVANTRTLKAEVWATEGQATGISKGDRADAVWRDVTIHGRVVQADLSLDTKKKAFGLVIEFDNPGGRMKAGVNSEIHVHAGKNSQAMIIDRKNVRTEGDSTFVFIANDSLAVKQPVLLGRRQEMNIEVIRGLEPGDRLITTGQMLLENNTKIRIVQE